jgi:hypothetical protein
MRDAALDTNQEDEPREFRKERFEKWTVKPGVVTARSRRTPVRGSYITSASGFSRIRFRVRRNSAAAARATTL